MWTGQALTLRPRLHRTGVVKPARRSGGVLASSMLRRVHRREEKRVERGGDLSVCKPAPVVAVKSSARRANAAAASEHWDLDMIDGIEFRSQASGQHLKEAASMSSARSAVSSRGHRPSSRKPRAERRDSVGSDEDCPPAPAGSISLRTDHDLQMADMEPDEVRFAARVRRALQGEYENQELFTRFFGDFRAGR